MAKPVIVILTHRSGTKFLANLLESFNGYDKYPILVVVSDYKDKDQTVFLELQNTFSRLPVILEHIRTNSFEFGGIYTAYHKTNYDEFLLLSHSCEIVNTEIFDMVFEKHKSRSVAFGLQSGNWESSLADLNKTDRKFILKHIDENVHHTLIDRGEVKFWNGQIGKYRRVILDKMNLLDYLPGNMVEAITKSEILFTSTYHSLDRSTVVLFPDWKDSDVYEEKFGRKRLKIGNDYIIKWKTHWSSQMVSDDMRNEYVTYRVRNWLREGVKVGFPGIYSTLKGMRRK